MTRRGSVPDLEASRRMGVNFQLARHRLDELGDRYSPVMRARALAAYVGAFDFADRHGVVTASSEEIAEAFGIYRPSWLLYRTILEEAGLVEVDARRGGQRRGFRLLPPT